MYVLIIPHIHGTHTLPVSSQKQTLTSYLLTIAQHQDAGRVVWEASVPARHYSAPLGSPSASRSSSFGFVRLLPSGDTAGGAPARTRSQLLLLLGLLSSSGFYFLLFRAVSGLLFSLLS